MRRDKSGNISGIKRFKFSYVPSQLAKTRISKKNDSGRLGASKKSGRLGASKKSGRLGASKNSGRLGASSKSNLAG